MIVGAIILTYYYTVFEVKGQDKFGSTIIFLAVAHHRALRAGNGGVLVDGTGESLGGELAGVGAVLHHRLSAGDQDEEGDHQHDQRGQTHDDCPESQGEGKKPFQNCSRSSLS